MAVNIKADKIVNSSDDEFSFFFTDLQEGQGLVFNAANNRWENGVVSLADGRRGSLSSISEMNSLRFDGSSYLSRTPTTAGNRKTWTWSGWVKKSELTANRTTVFAAGNGNYYLAIEFDGTNKFRLVGTTTGNGSSLDGAVASTQVFRDLNGWYHLMGVYSTTEATSTDRVSLYVNGVLMEDTSTTIYPALDRSSYINKAQEHFLGGGWLNTSYKFKGYLANIHFIDGQALDANNFGETISDVWVPKQYGSGDPSNAMAEYGTNGFHLDFAASNMDFTNSKVLDASGRGNHWTLN